MKTQPVNSTSNQSCERLILGRILAAYYIYPTVHFSKSGPATSQYPINPVHRFDHWMTNRPMNVAVQRHAEGWYHAPGKGQARHIHILSIPPFGHPRLIPQAAAE